MSDYGRVLASEKIISLDIVTKSDESRMSFANSVVDGIINPSDPELKLGGSGFTNELIDVDHPMWWGNESLMLSTWGFIPSNYIWKLPGVDPFYLLPVSPKP